MARAFTTIVLAMAAILGGAGAAWAQDAAAGRALAGTWCAGCHDIGGGQAVTRSDSVPAFAAIAARPGTSAATVSAFLAAPHGRMPNLTLSRAEIADLAAYVASLKPTP